MMMQMCSAGMMIVGVLVAVLGLGLLASLIVLVWVLIGRLRRDSGRAAVGTAPPR